MKTNSQKRAYLTVVGVAEDIKREKARSAWARGVKEYALELLDNLAEGIKGGWVDECDIESPKLLEKALLNGASDWNQYSWGGCALIYDSDIAERLCTPSELKKTHNGKRRPNPSEEWLDTQERALFQASYKVKKAIADQFSI